VGDLAFRQQEDWFILELRFWRIFERPNAIYERLDCGFFV
jgi:hypothetical protein